MAQNFQSLSNTVQSTATVGTSSTTILAANGDRTYAILINYGSYDITLGIEASAILGKGIILKSDGGFYEMSGQYGNNCRGIVTAIVDTTVSVINYMQAGGGV